MSIPAPIIPKLDHNWEEATLKEATCTEEGITGLKCSVCSATQETGTIPMVAHQLEHKPGKAPTCTEAGYADWEGCKNCPHESIKKVELPATGHSWATMPGTDPTCTAEGKGNWEACSKCNATIERQVGPQPVTPITLLPYT